MIDQRVEQPCPKCGTKFALHSRPIIDVDRQPELYARFLADELNPKACGGCGLKLTLDTPSIVVRRHWIGVVLANPRPIPIELASKVVHTFLSETPDLGLPPDRPVLVTGNDEQLRRVIRSDPDDRFCTVRFDDLTRRNWAQEIVALNVIADAYLEHDLPEQAYWVYESALATFPELYFHRRFFDTLELTALAAGDRIAGGLIEPRSAPDDLELKRQALEPQRPELPEWLAHTHLCFFEDDRYFDQPVQLWNVRVELLQLDEQETLPFDRAELHLTGVTPQAILPQEPSRLERGVMRILIVLAVAAARQMLPGDPLDFAWVNNLTGAFFQLDWERMSAAEQAQLKQIYSQYTGRDLVQDFALDDSG